MYVFPLVTGRLFRDSLFSLLLDGQLSFYNKQKEEEKS